MTQNDYSDFTLAAYAALLDKAAARYRFVRFDEAGDGDGRALWRHDIDFSPHRALAMAELEAAKGLRTSYFVQLTSPFYNALESEVAQRLQRIADLGHDIGVHFEPADDAPEDRLSFEAATLERALGIPVRMFSLHNPTTYDATRFDAGEVAGLINASAPSWRRDFAYCSDSNGLWRYRTLDETLGAEDARNLYALTHPEWWLDRPLPPRDRIQRCIEGRAAYCGDYYDSLLGVHGRPNIGREGGR